MALREILLHPDPRLRRVARPVADFGRDFQRAVDDMFETMYDEHGVGLAAPQIALNQRLMIVDVSEDQNQPLVFVNPVITAQAMPREMEEGCLSLPGFSDKVRRFERITVDALDRRGDVFTLDCEGLLAQCVQHELDHLNGVLFIDHLSALKRERITAKMTKLVKRLGQENGRAAGG